MHSNTPIAMTFVGRTRELDRLHARFAAAQEGTGGVILLAGEPGIGKTRLLEELADHARERGAVVLWGRCWEGEGAPAFWPWLQVLRAYLRDRDPATIGQQMGSGAADIAQAVPEVRAALPDLPFPPPLDADEARFRFFDSVTLFLRRAAAAQPLVLVLDDLHWADLSSVLLLRFLAQNLGVTRLLVLLAYRHTAPDFNAAFAEALASIRRTSSVQEVSLHGLAHEEVRLLVQRVAARDLTGADEPFLAALHDRTEGNPFFVQETLRHLAESGRVRYHEGHWAAIQERLDQVGLPRGVREVIGRRLVHLSDGCHRMLTIAAVFGREFETAVLLRVTRDNDRPGDVDALLDLLAEAERARLIAPMTVGATPGGYRFVHALIRETLYDALPAAQRVRLHRHVGEALEAVYGASAAMHLAELAHHFVEAAPGGDVEKAIAYVRRAAEQAAAIHAHEAAAQHYETALRLLPLMPTRDESLHIGLLLALGATYQRVADTPRLAAAYVKAAEIARAGGDVQTLVRAVVGLMEGKGEYSFDFGHADLALLQDTLAVIGEMETAAASRVRAWISLVHFISGDQDAARRYSGEAVRIAKAVGEPDALVIALTARHFAIYTPGNAEERLAILDEVIPLMANSSMGNNFRGGVRAWRLAVLHQLNRMDEADQEMESIAYLGDVLRAPISSSQDYVARASRALMAGQVIEAEEQLDLLQTLLERYPRLVSSQRMHQMVRFLLRRERQLGTSDGSLVAEVSAVAREPTLVSWMAQCLLAALLCDEARFEEAAEVFEVIARDNFVGLQVFPFSGSHLICAALLAEACAALGDSRAGALYERLLPYAIQNAVWNVMLFAPMARPLGLLATALCRWEAAEGHFRVTLAMSEAAGARAWVAWAWHDQAKMLLARDAPGDRKRAAGLLDRAETSADELSMVRLHRAVARTRADAETATSVGPPAAAPQRPDRLTVRELEVLRLMTTGCSNPEIARALVLSTKTVERHLANVYAKIGARNRVEATAYAARTGLL